MKDNKNNLKPKLAGRVCTLTRESIDQPYGFGIKSTSNKFEHIITDVKDFSPASASGLNSGDVVLEVNSKSIEQLRHVEIVELINALPQQVKILVDAFSQKVSESHTGEDTNSNNIDVTNERFETVSKNSLEIGQHELSDEDNRKVSIGSKDFNDKYYQNSLKNFKPKFKKCLIKTEHPSHKYGFGIFTNPDIKPKIMVFRIAVDSPAYRANLRELDVIVEIDKVNVRRKTINEVIGILNLSMKNCSVEILAIDNQGFDYYKERKISLVKKVASPENTETFSNLPKVDKHDFKSSKNVELSNRIENSAQNEIVEISITRSSTEPLGIGLQMLVCDENLSKDEVPTEYVSVIDVLTDSDADRGGVKAGDVILKINKKSPNSINEVIEILKSCSTINLFVRRKVSRN